MKIVAVFLAGLLVGAIGILLLTNQALPWPSRRSSFPSSIPTAMAPGGQVREFHLEAKPGTWEILPGTVTNAWTYNGQVPGPELRVREGDLVRVVLINHLPVPTTIHWHGVDLSWKMDGVPGLTQQTVQPGATFTYEFVATPAGTRMYHSHEDTNGQMELGLYGALIIEPRNGPRYDVDRTIILDERALDFTPEVAMGAADLRGADSGNGRGGAFQYDLFLMDGRAGAAIPPVKVKPHQRILLRLINLGNLPHAIHLHGHTFKIVATDGNPVPSGAQWRKDTVMLGPGERFDLEVVAYNPGVWMLHCHMPNHGDNGMMTVMQYEGFKPVGEHFMALPQHLPAPPPRPAPKETPGGHAPSPSRPEALTAASGTGPAGRVRTIPMVDNRYIPPTIQVRVGTRIRWLNRGQNIHTTTSLDGLWDSPALERRQAFAFTFTRPGEYRYLCRQHLRQGMIGTIIVK
jgi:FtsP/CotA-like multicopper oxidase with cupredoxin domain/plastocyanin